jgi:hypothetical protein
MGVGPSLAINFAAYETFRVAAAEHQARSIHWSPYDYVRVVNADP